MRKCQELVNALTIEYNETAKAKRLPKLTIKNKNTIGENYTAKYSAGNLSIAAGNPLAQAYALCQLNMAAKGKHLAEHLGDISPRFTLRPLWPSALHEIALTEKATIHIPEFIIAEDAEMLIPRICKRLIEWGYNAIIIGSQTGFLYSEEMPEHKTIENLNSRFQLFKDHGIELIIKPNFYIPFEFLYLETSPTSSDFKAALNTLYEQFPTIDTLFWESQWLLPSSISDELMEMTDAERVLKEICTLEKAIQQRSKLIFYLPLTQASEREQLRQARWMSSLADDMGNKSILAFNSVSGHLYADYSSNHPFWGILRQAQDSSATQLLPILNAGLIQQGEGLWPTDNFDLIERFLPSCVRHNFAGVIGLTASFPKAGSLHDCNLWVFGHALWRSVPPQLLAETWFMSFYPEGNTSFHLKVMSLCRSLALELTILSDGQTVMPVNSEEAKVHGDKILATLNQVKSLWKKQKSPSPLALYDYFLLFARDVKLLLGKFLPTYHLPTAHFNEGNEVTASFWPERLDRAYNGTMNSSMEAIYMDNRYL